MQPAFALGFVILFMAIHLGVGRLRFLSGVPRSRWLSLAGGAAVAYVFLHLLPELEAGQEVLAEAVGGVLGFVEHHVYLVALAGLVTFYGLDRLALGSRRRGRDQRSEDATASGVFRVHIASFALYNMLIGYLLLHREEGGLRGLAFFGLAMGLHLLVNDYGLREHHKDRYDRFGRWILCAAVLGGWGLGRVMEIDHVVLALLIAFLAGGVILNVMTEELPEERESRFSAFLAGAAVYALLLLGM